MSRLLIIDTDISLATVLSDYLTSRGYQAQFLTSGKAALAAMEQKPFDVVLTELHVDGINGFDLVRELRRRYPPLPLIVLTSRIERESQIRAFKNGADDYVTKPFSMDILICRIEAILRRIRQDEENRQRVFFFFFCIADALPQGRRSGGQTPYTHVHMEGGQYVHGPQSGRVYPPFAPLSGTRRLPYNCRTRAGLQVDSELKNRFSVLFRGCLAPFSTSERGVFLRFYAGFRSESSRESRYNNAIITL